MSTRQCEAFQVDGNIKRKMRVVDIDDSLVNIGSIPDAVKPYVTVVEKGDGIFRQAVVTIADLPLAITDTLAYAGVQIYQLPLGRITPIGAVGSIAMTTTSAISSTLNQANCAWGIGSATASNITLATTMQNFINITTVASSSTINVAGAVSNGSGIGIVTSIDGSSTPVKWYLNVSAVSADNIDGDATVTISGTLKISYVVLG